MIVGQSCKNGSNSIYSRERSFEDLEGDKKWTYLDFSKDENTTPFLVALVQEGENVPWEISKREVIFGGEKFERDNYSLAFCRGSKISVIKLQKPVDRFYLPSDFSLILSSFRKEFARID